MTHLSDVFKYISKFRHAGHQVGRKVGDMLEVLTYAALTYDDEMQKRLHIEPKLYGFTDAGHKVEFAILKDPASELQKAGEIVDPSKLIAFIECKKVGVEQTVDTSFKKAYKECGYKFREKSVIDTSLGKQGWEKKYKISISISKNLNKFFVEISVNNELILKSDVETGHRFIFALLGDQSLAVLKNDESLRDVSQSLERCKILEVLNVGNEEVEVLLNNCLPGPQTPEKAKQSAFVALDVRKLRFNHFDKRDNESELVSVLVLTEFSHWEQKSQNVVMSCLDKVLVVSDQLIVEAFQLFEEEFGSDFYDRITKDDFQKNENVRAISLDLIKKYDGFIFKDLSDGVVKKFTMVNNRFTIA